MFLENNYRFLFGFFFFSFFFGLGFLGAGFGAGGEITFPYSYRATSPRTARSGVK